MTVLYISYDGLTDPLGSSQIIPYLKGISKHQDNIIVLSFEKPDRIDSSGSFIKEDIKPYAIAWTPVRFTKGFGIFGKAWDLSKMYLMAIFLSYRHKVNIVHARGHLSAQVAYFIKKIFGIKLLFDFRGLWVDERLDKGGWDLNFSFHRIQYNYFKRIEKKILFNADHVVVLTDKVVNEVVSLGVKSLSRVTTIPCCADFNHFILSDKYLKNKAKNLANIPKKTFVIGYLGSVGNMYLLDRLLYFFKIVTTVRSDCHILFVTNDVSELENLIRDNLPNDLYNLVHIVSAKRNEVPTFIPAMDIMVSFILPSYARMAASPTKMAECFSAGIPVIANDGVGDVAKIINQLDGGKIVDPFSDQDLIKASNELEEISAKGGSRLRNASFPILGLDLANEKYKSVYEKLMLESC
ncbi:glycosyltransferase [bacterium]|jgi:glycosyltransferase involved in cell wall biosynthesis|nr:glycosyltransferase [bacterium]